MKQNIRKTLPSTTKSQRSSSNPSRTVDIIFSLFKKPTNMTAKANSFLDEPNSFIQPKKEQENQNLSQYISPDKMVVINHSLFKKVGRKFVPQPREIIYEKPNESDRAKQDSESFQNKSALPACLNEVISDDIKILKLEKNLLRIKNELNEIKIKILKISPDQLLEEKLLKLCQEPTRRCVDEIGFAFLRIYGEGTFNVIYNTILKKVIKYQNIKQYLKNLLKKPKDLDPHLDHIIPERPRSKSPFPLRFEQQTSRRPFILIKNLDDNFIPSQEILKTEGSETAKKTFYTDPLKSIHNFDSYVKRDRPPCIRRMPINHSKANSFTH